MGQLITWGKYNRGAKVHGGTASWGKYPMGQLYNVGQMSVGANVDTPSKLANFLYLGVFGYGNTMEILFFNKKFSKN